MVQMKSDSISWWMAMEGYFGGYTRMLGESVAEFKTRIIRDISSTKNGAKQYKSKNKNAIDGGEDEI